MSFLLEHGNAQATGERFFPRVHAQMRFQIPRHSKLFAAVLAFVFPQLLHFSAVAPLNGRR